MTISSNLFPEPSLLATCKQVRGEAWAILYTDERTFLLDIGDYDSTAFVTLAHKVEHSARPMESSARPIGTDVPSSNNLLLWLRRAHQIGYPLLSLKAAPEASTHDQVIYGLFDLVRELRENLPWERVERLILSQRPVLVTIDGRWSL